MAQQTAVEWLEEELADNLKVIILNNDYTLMEKLFAKAKAMEKEQILNADLNATIRTAKGVNADVSVKRVKELAEKYYNETYNK